MRLQGIAAAAFVLIFALIAAPTKAETITLGPALPGVFMVGEGNTEEEQLTLEGITFRAASYSAK